MTNDKINELTQEIVKQNLSLEEMAKVLQNLLKQVIEGALDIGVPCDLDGTVIPLIFSRYEVTPKSWTY